MPSLREFDDELSRRLEGLQAQGLYRALSYIESAQSPRVLTGGRAMLNFASNDYLGFADHPFLKEAAIRAVEKYGAGAGASRLICGSQLPHRELDAVIAAFEGAEAALGFSTGYAAALGTIGALLGKDDIIVLDRLVHASIVDAARLCGAKLRVFPHNDPGGLESILKWARQRSPGSTRIGSVPRVLIVTESIFSMDGDHAPLRELVQLKERYGAWLMVDEAHATGLYGARRTGLIEAAGVSDQIEIRMGTLGKAIGAAGGYVCGSRLLVDYLVNRARSLIFSTAPVPAAAAAAAAGVQLVQSDVGRERCQSLWERVAELNLGLEELRNGGHPIMAVGKSPARIAGLGGVLPSAIIPILLADETLAVAVSKTLRNQDIFVPAIRYPTVARDSARLRITLSAAHSSEEISSLLGALRNLSPLLFQHASAREA